MVGIGVVTGRIYEDMYNSTTVLDKLAAVGTRYIRIEFEEHGASFTPDYKYKKILADAQARNIRVLGVLTSNSCQFKDNEPSNSQPWNNAETYIAKFYESVKWHMNSYAYVTEWEIWNEPDQYGFKGHESDYGLLLKRVYEWARNDRQNGVIPKDTRICSAGIVNPEYSVLSKIYDTQAVNDFRAVNNGDIPCDIFSYHPYGLPDARIDPDTNGFYGGGTFEKSFQVFQGLRTQNYSRGSVPLVPTNKPIWFTEFGFNSSYTGTDNQANFLQKMVRVMRKYPIIQRAFVYDFQDDKGGGAGRLGLFDVNLNPKNAWNTYAGFPK